MKHSTKDRPLLEFEGCRYHRFGGDWADPRTNMRPPKALSLRLDAEAQRRGLWLPCLNQDEQDSPSGRITSELSDVTDADQQPNPGPPTKGRGAPSQWRNDGAYGLNLKFINGAKKLSIACDFERGWQDAGKAWLYNCSDRIDLPSDRVLRISVILSEEVWQNRKWSGPGDGAAAAVPFATNPRYPEFDPFDFGSSGIQGRLNGKTCEIVIAVLADKERLNPDLTWDVGGATFEISQSDVYERALCWDHTGTTVARPFQLRLRGTIEPTKRPPIGPEYEHDTPMASAGLPGQGKRPRT